ncbi:MAG TPA: hypothetical protein VJY40_06465 [Corynebacterium sp.]|nr:hypothetical protein [Corynebacterium sp.]
MTTTEISSSSLSTAIIRDLFRDGLRAAVAGGDIADPSSARRNGAAPMVLTEFPDRGLLYPHIVVGEGSDVGDQPDSRADLWQHTYAVGIEIHAKSSTQMFRLRDEVRAWVEGNVDTLNAAGFTDPQMSPGIPMNWDANEQIRRWKFVVKGTVYTTPGGA